MSLYSLQEVLHLVHWIVGHSSSLLSDIPLSTYNRPDSGWVQWHMCLWVGQHWSALARCPLHLKQERKDVWEPIPISSSTGKLSGMLSLVWFADSRLLLVLQWNYWLDIVNPDGVPWQSLTAWERASQSFWLRPLAFIYIIPVSATSHCLKSSPHILVFSLLVSFQFSTWWTVQYLLWHGTSSDDAQDSDYLALRDQRNTIITSLACKLCGSLNATLSLCPLVPDTFTFELWVACVKMSVFPLHIVAWWTSCEVVSSMFHTLIFQWAP